MIGVLMSKKILIADDEQNIVISIEFLLRREGFEVLVASDGEEALARVRAERPDLVLLDVMMPKMNGFDVCQALRADPDLSSTRILMLTAKGRDTEVSKGLGLGCRWLHDQALLDQGTARRGAQAAGDVAGEAHAQARPGSRSRLPVAAGRGGGDGGLDAGQRGRTTSGGGRTPEERAVALLVVVALAACALELLGGCQTARTLRQPPLRMAEELAARWRTMGCACPSRVRTELRVLARRPINCSSVRDALEQDVAERVNEARASLEEERSRLAALMADLSQSVVVCNLDGRVLLVQPAGPQELSGGADGSTLGLGTFDLHGVSIGR
jgi:two-component system alkaline phosphatase synthesis response regulator PhoP